MSTASAKPTPRLWTDKGIDYIVSRLTNPNIEHKDELIEGAIDIIRELRVASAPPAAERPVLKALRAYCVYQRENFEIGIRDKPTHPRARDWSAYAVAYTDIINEIDAQEKTF